MVVSSSGAQNKEMRELSRLRWWSGVQWGNKGGAISGGMLQALPRKKRDPTPQRGRCPNTFPLLSMSVFNERLLQRHMG